MYIHEHNMNVERVHYPTYMGLVVIVQLTLDPLIDTQTDRHTYMYVHVHAITIRLFTEHHI